MKGAWLAAALLLAVPAAALADGPGPRAGQLGLGVMLGDPIAGTLKYFVTDKSAVDFGIGASQDLVLIADYVWHGWTLLPQPKRGQLGVYLSGGPRLEMEDPTDFGIRTMAGLSYWPKLKTRTAEFFLELGPVYRLTPAPVRVRVDGGFGVRVYFSPSR